VQNREILREWKNKRGRNKGEIRNSVSYSFIVVTPVDLTELLPSRLGIKTPSCSFTTSTKAEIDVTLGSGLPLVSIEVEESHVFRRACEKKKRIGFFFCCMKRRTWFVF
jgi:hypothetical protein